MLSLDDERIPCRTHAYLWGADHWNCWVNVEVSINLITEFSCAFFLNSEPNLHHSFYFWIILEILLEMTECNAYIQIYVPEICSLLDRCMSSLLLDCFWLGYCMQLNKDTLLQVISFLQRTLCLQEETNWTCPDKGNFWWSQVTGDKKRIKDHGGLN